MKRIIASERIFSISNYNNIKYIDTEEFELSEEKALDQGLVNLIFYNQAVNAELNFLRYMQLKLETGKLTLQEALNYLETEKANAQTELEKQLLQKELDK
jgi:hypothetical protein